MKFTRQGYGELRRQDGTLVSRHLVAEEAYERASRAPGVYVYVPAPVRIDVEAPPQAETYWIDGAAQIGT